MQDPSDLVAYSVMTSHEYMFRDADAVARKWAHDRGRKLPRIMGGAHPTYFPEVLNELALDAICLGDGDFAIIEEQQIEGRAPGAPA